MAAWLKRIVPSLALDSLVVVALAIPGATAYLRWPLLALYGLLSLAFFRELRSNSWIFRIVGDRATRVAHGLEHATLAVLMEQDVPAIHGFTHGRDRFVVALKGQQTPSSAVVLEAAVSAIRRVLSGEHGLAYQPGCGTTDVVSVASLWLVYVASVVFTLLVGGAIPIFVAVSIVGFRIWLACETSFGLLAQRLFTVSTAFTSATVIDVRETSRIWNFPCPNGETWFEVVVDVRIAASQGGLVSA